MGVALKQGVAVTLYSFYLAVFSELCILIELLVNLTISHRFKGYGSLSAFMKVIAMDMNNEKRTL